MNQSTNRNLKRRALHPNALPTLQWLGAKLLGNAALQKSTNRNLKGAYYVKDNSTSCRFFGVICRSSPRRFWNATWSGKIFGNPDDILEKSYNYENGINLKPGYVKATTFWLVDEHHFIGEIGIRHELTPLLFQYGGNIGYEIRFSECHKGFGSKMLSMVLPYCKNTLNLKRVLITCDDDNIGSQKVIENNGGKLENKVINTIDRGTVLTTRYWIAL